MTESKVKVCAFTLSPGDEEKLERLAKQEYRNKSEMVRTLIRRAPEGGSPPPPEKDSSP